MTSNLRVALGERSYDILVGQHVLGNGAGDAIARVIKSKSVIIVSDEHVARFYLHRLSNALEEQQIRSRSIIVKAGEASKSYSAFADLMENILEQKPDRNTTLIALGGGVVGDLTGFAASVCLRGLDFIQIPTSLLAQVDSSVGGKTGINSKFGKNLIGSFHQPILVIADVETLATLPARELMSGYAEIVKYGLINDPPLFTWLEKNAVEMLSGKRELVTEAVVASCNAKAAIVAADEKEQGQRALLNFGHTFAHAFEAETGFSQSLLHGEAVAIGMILAFQASVKMGLCDKVDYARVKAHYEATGLPLSPQYVQKEWNIDALMEHFTRDKKAKDGALTFVLTHGIGKAFVANNVDNSVIRETLVEACRGV